MKIIYNNLLPPKDFSAINLFGVILARKECKPLSDRTKNHESIHTAQGKELLWVFFYLFYVLEWIIRLIQHRDRKLAYRNISFEREAYSNQTDTNYLKNRNHYSFVKYLKVK